LALTPVGTDREDVSKHVIWDARTFRLKRLGTPVDEGVQFVPEIYDPVTRGLWFRLLSFQHLSFLRSLRVSCVHRLLLSEPFSRRGRARPRAGRGKPASYRATPGTSAFLPLASCAAG